MTPDERDRLVRLEERFGHLDEKLDDATHKINEMHVVLMKAKGARWAVIATASVVTFLVTTATQMGSYIKTLLPAMK